MAVIKTIKSSGGDYNSIYNAIIANTSFSADTDFIISSDITEPGRYVGTISLNGYIVKFYPDLFGRVIYTQNIGGVNFTIDNGSNGELHFSSCILTQELKPTGYYAGAVLTVASNAGSGKVIIDSNICKCFNGLGSYGANDGIYINVSSNKEVQCTNNKVYKSGLRGINLNINSGTGTNLNLENNTVDECNLRNLSYGAGIRTNGVTGDNTKLKNNVSTRNLYADFSDNITLPNFLMDNNSDSDGTFNGTAVGISGHNLNSTTIVPANEFLSLDYTDSDYLKIDGNSTGLAETGTVPTYALLDIAGNTRGGNGTYSRGCYEYISIASFYDNFIIDSGAIYINFTDFSSPGILIGATKGGNTFSIEPEFIDMEYDGALGLVKGGRVIAGVIATLNVNLIECSLSSIKKAIPGSFSSKFSANWDIISRRGVISETDYIDNVVLIADILGKDNAIGFKLNNCLVDSNIELNLADKEESVMSLTFKAHYTLEQLQTEPWEILYPNS